MSEKALFEISEPIKLSRNGAEIDCNGLEMRALTTTDFGDVR